jgi:RsiW-degrading membrane proteinase PrsW (M82 family)
MEGLRLLVFFVAIVMFYLLPAFVADQRRHHQRLAITVLNVLAGWTAIGWIVALVWACTADVELINEDEARRREQEIVRNAKNWDWH